MQGDSRRNRACGYVVSAILPERSAHHPRNLIHIKAGLSIAVVLIDAGEQPMALAAHVTELEERISRQFTLNGEMVLFGILASQCWREVPKQQNGAKEGEVDR